MLPTLDRFPYSAIPHRPDFDWPEKKRVAVFVALNLEHFIFGEGGVDLDRPTPPPNHRSYLWRDYGNRVGVWRLLDLFEELAFPVGVIANAAIYEHCPEVMQAFQDRGDEIIGHGITNSKPQGQMTEQEEQAMIAEATQIITEKEGAPPKGWLSPYLTPSDVTPDLLKEAGYEYLLDWGLCDDQPFWSYTRAGPLLVVPYPLELNDQPAIVFRRNTASQFVDMAVDALDEHIRSANRHASVCAVSLHSFIFGQPFRIKHLRRFLQYVKQQEDEVWVTNPSAIADHFRALPTS